MLTKQESYFADNLKPLLNKVKSRLKNKESISLIDVGCGYFRYGKALHSLLSNINPNIEIIAVDKKKMTNNYHKARFIKEDITKLNLKPDIISVFNPFPAIPDIKHLTKKGTILIGCVDWNPKAFKESLKSNNFKVIAWQKNKFWKQMRPWFNNYDPFVIASREQ